MAKDFLYPGTILSIHKKAADKLLSAGSGDAALLYLALLDRREPSSFGWEAARLETAHGILLSLGLVDPVQPIQPAPVVKLEPESPPDYNTADIQMALQNGKGFAGLRTEVERMLGKSLSPADLKTLYLLYDFLALPPEVILLLVGWCIERTVKKHGAGRKPTMNQIKNEGFRWQKAGVDTLDAADAHLQRLAELDTRVARIMEVIDLRGRKPVAAERKYLDAWAGMGMADDAIRLAYETTVVNCGKMVWTYMDAVLKRWKSKGFLTAAAVKEGEGKRQNPYRPANQRGQAAPPPPGQQKDDADWLFNLTRTPNPKGGT